MKTPTEQLIEYRKIRKNLEKYKHSLESQKQYEFERLKQEIEKKYNIPIENTDKNIEHYSNQIKEINEKVVNYSTFYYKSIVSVLRQLLRIYEGKNFILCDLKYQPNPERRIITEEARVLVSQERKKFVDHNCDKNKLYAIQKNGDGIILDWDINRKKYIKFYDLTKDGELKYNIKLNKFPYIKEFIDYLITYQFKNSIDGELDEQELIDLMELFIRENVDEILKYHITLADKEEEKMKKQIEENCEYRAKQLNKVLDRFYGGNYEI